jgi:hypothetical protein
LPNLAEMFSNNGSAPNCIVILLVVMISLYSEL